MKSKTICKIVIDIIMTVLLLVLMAYQFVGQKAHEWLGASMFSLFIAHNILNFRWYGSLFKGKYTPYRILQTVLNLLLLALMSGQMVSGMMMSRHVFAFLPIRGAMSFARTLHMLGAYWGFALMSVHLGLHLNMIMGMARKATGIVLNSVFSKILPGAIAALISAYGIYALIKHDISSYLFLNSQFVFFDYEQSAVSFFAEYLAIMGLFVFASHYAAKLIQKCSSKQKQREEEQA